MSGKLLLSTAVMFTIICGTNSQGVPGDAQKIIFPAPRGTDNHARLEPTLPEELTSFTLCLHMRSNMTSSHQIGLVSYAVPEHHNELLLFVNGGFNLYVQDSKKMGDPAVWDGEWHAICTTWRSSDGVWELYADGVLKGRGSGFNVGGKVRSGGAWILGQDQDIVGGGFDANQAFVGELSEVNLWDRVLSPAEMGAGWAASCGLHGNVIDWDTTNIEVFGETSRTEYQCIAAGTKVDDYIPGDAQKIIFPAPRGTDNHARLDTTLSEELTSFTLCLHMRSNMTSSHQIGLVSYAVPEHHNELLLFVNDGFNLYIQNFKKMGDPAVWDGEWHAICTTWRSSDGVWQLYADGALKGRGSGFNVGGKVRSGGAWILGQDQDIVGGGFDANQAFVGELSEVNLWDRVLSPAEIGADWAAFCGLHGNVIDWDTTNIELFGETSRAEYQCVCSVDIVFVVDLSWSIGMAQFEVARQFILDFVRCFGNQDVNIGVITYDCVPRTFIGLGTYALGDAGLLEAIQGLVYSGGLSRTSLAIRHMTATSNFRDEALRAAAVLTDGNAQSDVNGQITGDFAFEANEARSADIALYSVAIGNPVLVNDVALKAISGESDHVFDSDNACEVANRILKDLCG
ncbi:uncharacterized protein [Branchiostoma lanceolatum]|uniref:uncharacterized protein isoform X2 n=1 Tax=Branchiostoma lanceolatum TaxID=7740 RepID=UPI0034539F3F